jgi:3',5'-cyclic-AMP phosphodiesterase
VTSNRAHGAAAAAASLAAVILALGGCLDAAEERARRDDELGRAQAGGARVEVAGGLAVVRELAPGTKTLVMWSKAPSLRARLFTGPAGGGTWSLTVANALPDCEASARIGADGAATPLFPIPALGAATTTTTTAPTTRSFAAELPADTEVELAFAPDDAGSAGRFRFAVFGDVQEKLPSVGDIYARMRAERDLRFVLMSGDLTKHGTPAELERFEAEAAALPIPLYPTLGNHELDSDGGGRAFADRFGRGTFHFVYRGVAFTFLDSASATVAPLAYRWLDRWLDEQRHAPHIVVSHIPPLDPFGLRGGSFASRNEAADLLGRLARAGVDATFYGHIHSYYAFTNAGIPAFISGGGGSYPEAFDGIGRHFLVVDVDPAGAGAGAPRLTVTVVRVE